MLDVRSAWALGGIMSGTREDVGERRLYVRRRRSRGWALRGLRARSAVSAMEGRAVSRQFEDALTALLFTVAICGVLGATAGVAWFAYQVVRANPVAAVATMATVVVMWGVAYAVIRRATR